MRYGVRVREVMLRNPLTVRPEETVYRALKRMIAKKTGSAIVTDKKKQVLGIVTEGDMLDKIILQRKDSMKTSVYQVMTKNVVTIGPDEDLSLALNLMKKHDIKKLPVVDDGKLAGLITDTELSRVQPSILDVLIEKLKIKEPSFKFSFWEK